MSGNRSLDEFAGSDGEEGADGQRVEDGAAAEDAVATDESATSEEGGSVAAESADDDHDSTSADRRELDPPASTYVWSPDGENCGACGATVSERWRDGDDLVCAGCKEW